MQNVPKLDCAVFLICYNHKDTIERAIQGILDQKTIFTFHLFISDDCSTDGTIEICKRYAEGFPDKISLNVNICNLGSLKNAIFNYVTCINSDSKYIALLEGDDYWIGDDKLEKQIKQLESHKDYSLSFGNVLGNTKNKYLNSGKQYFTLADITESNFVHTCTIVFRTEYLEEFIPIMEQLKIGDYPICIYLATKGNLGYINEVIGFYSYSNAGEWSGAAEFKKFKLYENIISYFIHYLRGKENFDRLESNLQSVYNFFLGEAIKESLTTESQSNLTYLMKSLHSDLQYEMMTSIVLEKISSLDLRSEGDTARNKMDVRLGLRKLINFIKK